MHVAPPKDRLRAPIEPHAAMLVQHNAQLPVDPAFDHVAGRRDRAVFGWLFVEAGEQSACPRKLLKAPAGTAQALMLEHGPAAHGRLFL